MLKYLLISLLICSNSLLLAQNFKKEKRIYLLDTTESMSGYKGSDNIYEKVKAQLINAINEVEDNNTELVVIPYAEKTYSPISGKKNEIIERISKLKATGHNTNIAAAWEKGVASIDPSKINYMFLLTDGKHNHGVPSDSFYNILRDWGKFAHDKYYFAFYVMLTQNAEDRTIQDIVNCTPQMWAINNMNINITFVKMPFSLRINEYVNHEFVYLVKNCNHPKLLSSISDFSISLEKNPYYRIEYSKFDYAHKNIRIKLKHLKKQEELPVSVKLKAKINYNKEKTPFLFFTPDDFYIIVDNRGKRKMTFKQDVQFSKMTKE